MIKVGIIGGAGYTGGELIRILLNHPEVNIAFVQSGSNAGNLLSKVHQDLLGDTDIQFIANCLSLNKEYVDVLFFCAGHGEAKKFVLENEIDSAVKLIDIGNDFRLKEDAEIKGRTFVYGLPELNRKAIQQEDSIANPGCFATAIQLGLLPFIKAGAIETQKEIFTTGITGSTGAGQGLSATSHFSWRSNNIQAYKTLTHQHNEEILQSLMQASNGNHDISLNFVPWRGDFTRGIFVSSTFTTNWSKEQIIHVLEEAYQNEPFTKVSLEPIHLKQVVNTNKCIINIEKEGNKVVVHSMIDNLLKGASGQAVQNMNILFGLDEKLGLNLKGAAF